MSRQKHPIDWEQVEKMCFIQCLQEEIASVVGCCLDTLQTRCKQEYGISFSEFYKQKRDGGKISLRRKQFQRASDGSDTMLVWLGKNYLGQTDKREVTEKETKPIQIQVINPYAT